MKLEVIVPERVVVEREVDKIVAKGGEGSFALLPRHIDLATSLEPGVVKCHHGDESFYVALDRATLLKRGDTVRISARRAVSSEDLESLEGEAMRMLESRTDEAKRANVALAKLQASFVRRFIEFHER